MSRALRLLGGGLLALVLLPSSASAETRDLPVALGLEGEKVTAAFSIAPALTTQFRRRVAGGLESRLEIETRLLDREGEPVGHGFRTCKLLYSVWDERVYVSIEDEGRQAPRILTFLEVEPAIAACTEPRQLPVALAGALALEDGYRLEARVALNPVSEELVERSRQFITNPRGGARDRPNAVLGAVAGLFGSRGGALGELIEFRSPPLARPARGPVATEKTETPTQSAGGGRPAP